MSRRRKLEKFASILESKRVYELTEIGSPELRISPYEVKAMNGQWGKKMFGNDHPIVAELACGRGEYTIGLAKRYPNKNFIGVDIKGARIWQGVRIADELELDNVAFLRIRIEQIDVYFDQGELDEIWVTFPDPFAAKENRRTSSPRFLDRYTKILKSGGALNIKTDDDDFFEYSFNQLQRHPAFEQQLANDDIYAQELIHPDLDIKTYYEKQHLANGKTIKFLRYQYSKQVEV